MHRMPNKCFALGCSDGYDTNDDQKIASFHFPHAKKDLLEKWIKFDNRRNWEPSTNSSLFSSRTVHQLREVMYSQVSLFKVTPPRVLFESRSRLFEPNTAGSLESTQKSPDACVL